MDSGLEERILPSIRRSLIILIYRNDGVDNLETFGQTACSAMLSEGWRPSVRSRARSGDYPSVSRWAQAARSEGHRRHDQCVSTGGTISVWAQATRSVFCRAESALVADSAVSNRVGGADNPETFGQIACSVGRPARSFFCRAESASFADSAAMYMHQLSGDVG